MKTNDQYGKFISRGEVRILRTLPGPIERVWQYLTDSEKRARWFAGGAMEQRKGGKVALKFKHKDLAPGEEQPEQFQKDESSCDFTAEITRWEPPSGSCTTRRRSSSAGATRPSEHATSKEFIAR